MGQKQENKWQPNTVLGDLNAAWVHCCVLEYGQSLRAVGS